MDETENTPPPETAQPRESAIKKRIQNSQRAKELNDEIKKSGAILKEGLQDLTGNRAEKIEALKQTAAKNKMIVFGTIGAIVVLIGGLFYWQQGNRPYQASTAYGVCRNFLELYVQYPDFLRIASVTERQPSKLEHAVRIWYSQRDSFGQTRMERMECFYRKQPSGIILSKVEVDTRELPREMIDKFSAALPGIMQVETDLTVPGDFPNRIRDLKLDTNQMRKRYF
jgi:hypothetical protein